MQCKALLSLYAARFVKTRKHINMSTSIEQSPLGQKTVYVSQYTPSLLFPIARETGRTQLNLHQLPNGMDIWNALEISWLNTHGKPCVAIASIQVPASSPFLTESKSLKLYLNSFNDTVFESQEAVRKTIEKDISQAIQAVVSVHLRPIEAMREPSFTGTCIDNIELAIDYYGPVAPSLLKIASDTITQETLFSHLLKSNCPCTQQPDWGCIIIQYTGPQIDHSALLKYIISYRNSYEFAEQCVERAFNDILTYCNPTSLTVQALYTRRGGIDINPIRTTEKTAPSFTIRDPRQ